MHRFVAPIIIIWRIAETSMPRIALKSNIIRVACLCLRHKEHRRVHTAQKIVLGIDYACRLAVTEAHDFNRLRIAEYRDCLPVCLFRNGKRCVKPNASPFMSPACFRGDRRKECFVRRNTQMLIRFICSYGFGITYYAKHFICVHSQNIVKFPVCTVNVCLLIQWKSLLLLCKIFLLCKIDVLSSKAVSLLILLL